MSIALGTRSAAVVNGRCTGCGRFIKKTESHFHSGPRKFPGPPRAHLWVDGGGMVTRCDDPEVAQGFIIRKYLRDAIGGLILDEDREDAKAAFPIGTARVERGRVVPCDPDADYRWLWKGDLPMDAKGPGITTAVVWY